MKKKGVLSIMMAVAMAANLAGCGSSGTDAGSGEPTKTAEVSSEKEETSSGADKAASAEAKSDKVVSDITIAYVPTTMNNPFWTAMMGGIKDAMTDKGMDPGRQLVTVDAESDQATMNNYIYDLINQELLKYAEYNRNCYFVTGEKLYPNPDGIHINAESQRILGIRYFKAYQTKSNVVEPLDNEANMVKELCEREYTIAEKRYITLEQFTLGKSSMEEVLKFLK